MFNEKILIIGGGVAIFLLVNGAILNALIHEKKAVEKTWLLIRSAFSLRSDLIPLLLVTFQEYKKLDHKSLEAIIKQKHLCYLEHTEADNAALVLQKTNENLVFEKFMVLEKRLDNFIDQLIAEGEKTPNLKSDIDFLEIKQILKARREEVVKLLAERKELAATYNQRLTRWYAFLVRLIFRLKPASIFE